MQELLKNVPTVQSSKSSSAGKCRERRYFQPGQPSHKQQFVYLMVNPAAVLTLNHQSLLIFVSGSYLMLLATRGGKKTFNYLILDDLLRTCQ